MQIGAATAELTQSLGRSPTPRELAETIGCSVEEIIEGIESSNAYATLSLDASDDTDEGGGSMLEAIGIEDENLAHVEIRESLKPLLDALGPREKKILLLRFFRNKTQTQIAVSFHGCMDASSVGQLMNVGIAMQPQFDRFGDSTAQQRRRADGAVHLGVAPIALGNEVLLDLACRLAPLCGIQMS